MHKTRVERNTGEINEKSHFERRADLHLCSVCLPGQFLRLKRQYLALYEPPFNNPAIWHASNGNAHPVAMNYTRHLMALQAEGRRGDAVELAMIAFGAYGETFAGMRPTPVWIMFESVAPMLAYDNAIMGDGSVPTHRIASVNLPVLIMDGGASPSWMHDAAQAVAAALPGSQRRTLQDQTHNVDPEVLAPVLEDFTKA